MKKRSRRVVPGDFVYIDAKFCAESEYGTILEIVWTVFAQTSINRRHAWIVRFATRDVYQKKEHKNAQLLMYSQVGACLSSWICRGKRSQKEAKMAMWRRFGPIFASRETRWRDNYWTATFKTCQEVVKTDASSNPEPSARQMFVTAWESSFLSKKTALFSKSTFLCITLPILKIRTIWRQHWIPRVILHLVWPVCHGEIERTPLISILHRKDGWNIKYNFTIG